MGNGNAKKIIHLGLDGLPNDGVEHVAASEAQLQRYQEAAGNPLAFKTPLLHDLENPHSYLILGLPDGTGNDVVNDPLHASNVGKLSSVVERLNLAGTHRIHAAYIEGPGTQRDALTGIWDGATGDTSMARAEKLYWDIANQADRIFEADPRAKVTVALAGFSRGASEEAVLARMLHERGLPDLSSEVRTLDADGNVIKSYDRYHQTPGRTPLAVGLYDPVATGALEYVDRRLPPSTVSAFQITSADERRGTFPSDRLLFPNEELVPDRVSADGRFREVVLPGKHSNMGGGYLRDGISTKNYNLMTDYLNSMVSHPVIPRLPETDDPRLNVFHESHQGNLVFRAAPKASRDTPKGQVHDIVPDRTHIEPLGQVVTRFQSAPERMDQFFDRYVTSGRVQTQSPVPPASTTHGDVLLARVTQDTGYVVKPYEAPALQRPNVRIAGALGVVGVGTAVADAVHTGQRFDTLLAQDNLLGAKHELRNFAANNTNAWVAAYTVGKLGAEMGGRRGEQGAIAGGIAGGVVGYVMSDKAMEGLDGREIANQVDALGQHWHFNGNQWVRPINADLSGTGQVQEVNFAADLDARRELDYKATNKSVEIGMSRLPPPRNPYELDAGAQDKVSMQPAPWTRDPDTGRWHRDRIADIEANGRFKVHDRETAPPERAAQLDEQAAKVIEANIVNGPAPIAARYQLSHRLNGWQGDPPAAVTAALNADSLQASNGQQYQRGVDGQWRHGDEVAQGNLAAELDATREALQPKLQSHEQTMAQLPAWQRPTQAQEDLVSLAETYRGFGVAPTPETLAAVQLAIHNTREQHNIDPAATSLALDPNSKGQRDINSSIMHLQVDNDGAVRVAAITSALDVELARRELRTQGFNLDAPVPTTPEQVVERPGPEQREVQAQVVAEAQRLGATPEQVQQVAAQALDDRQQTVEQRIELSEPSRAHAGPSMGGGGRSPERDEQQEPEQRQTQAQVFPTDHHDYALFVAIQQQLPKDTPDEKTAEILHQAKLGGITRPEQLDEVVVERDRALVFGKTAGDYSQAVSMGAQAPDLNETLQRTQDFDQQQALQMQQFQEQQARINQSQGGPMVKI